MDSGDVRDRSLLGVRPAVARWGARGRLVAGGADPNPLAESFPSRAATAKARR
jgi:hypothetical protein